MSDPTLRAFFAVELPEPACEAIAERVSALSRALPEGVRWTDPGQYHVTLKFLGEVEASQLPALLRAAARKLARCTPFEAELGGIGGFPSARAARVAWVGIGSGAGSLARLARQLDSAAARAGVPRERRPYSAHVTVGRLREPQPLPLGALAEPFPAAPLNGVAVPAGPDPGAPDDEPPNPAVFPVEAVTLFESRLSSRGAQYAPCARLHLPPQEDDLSDFSERFAFAPELH